MDNLKAIEMRLQDATPEAIAKRLDEQQEAIEKYLSSNRYKQDSLSFVLDRYREWLIKILFQMPEDMEALRRILHSDSAQTRDRIAAARIRAEISSNAYRELLEENILDRIRRIEELRLN